MSIRVSFLVFVAPNNVEYRVMRDVDGVVEELRGENFSSLNH